MKGKLAPRILAGLLFVALLAAPAIMQEGLASVWASWGLPLLAAVVVLVFLMVLVFGTLALGKRISRRRAPIAEDAEAPEEAGEAEGPREAGEAGEAEEAEDQAAIQPDTGLTEALSELQPENFMDLARALEEMGRYADTLEVLALEVERNQGESAEEVASALRRLRLKLERDNSQEE